MAKLGPIALICCLVEELQVPLLIDQCMVNRPGRVKSIDDFSNDVVVLRPKCGVVHYLLGLIQPVLTITRKKKFVDACFEDGAETNVVACHTDQPNEHYIWIY